MANHQLCHALCQLHRGKEIHGENTLHLRRIRHQEKSILRHDARIVDENIDRLFPRPNLLHAGLDAILFRQIEDHRLNPYTVLLRKPRACLQKARFRTAGTCPYIRALRGKIRKNGGTNTTVCTRDDRISTC